MRTCTL